MVVRPVFSEFNASVDRSSIATHETLELTLRTDTSKSISPDLEILKQNFDIRGTSQNQQVQIINGKTDSWKEWVITLSPKRTGSLTIPSITLGNERSLAFDIHVQNNSFKNGQIENYSPVFMQAELNHNDVYIQQQAVLTLKILHSVSLYDESHLTPIEIDDAIVKQIGETKKYDSIISGTRYGVFELKFAISPQKSGKITIPALSFNGTMASRRESFGGMFSSSIFSMRGGKPVVARSQEIMMSVKEPPADYPKQPWLPAQDLTLSDSWSQSVNTIKVGDAITRTITLTAEGLSAAQLPPLHIPSPSGINIYPDESSSNDYATINGITGERQSAIAMIPTEAGTITLPPVKVTWFNTKLHSIQVAEIPETTLNIQDIPTNEPKQQLQTADTTTSKDHDSTTSEIEDNKPSTWKLIAATLAGLWLLTVLVFFAFWKKPWNRPLFKTKSSKTQTPEAEQVSISEPSEVLAYQALQNACINGDKPEIILEHMKRWCRLFLNDSSLITAKQCAERLESEQLKLLCAEIDENTYSRHNQQTTGDEMLSICSVIRKTFNKVNTEKDLDELYPE